MKTNIENKIIKKLDQILKALEDKEELITSEAACLKLGITKHTLYKMTSKAEISHYKSKGNKLYFIKPDIDEYAKNRRVLKKCQTVK